MALQTGNQRRFVPGAHGTAMRKLGPDFSATFVEKRSARLTYAVHEPSGYTPKAASAHGWPTSIDTSATTASPMRTGALGFVAGTMIATENGHLPIEALGVGSRLLTASGSIRTVRRVFRRPIKSAYMGRRRGPLVLIVAGALDDNVPCRNLYVEPEHPLLIDGTLVAARTLVNGTHIRLASRHEIRHFAFLRVELDGDDLVIAEGTACAVNGDGRVRRAMDTYAGDIRREIPDNLPQITGRRPL